MLLDSLSTAKAGILQFSALSAAAFLLYYTQAPVFHRLTAALLQQGRRISGGGHKDTAPATPQDHQKPKQALPKKRSTSSSINKPSQSQAPPPNDSLFPTVVYSDLASTNKNVVSCATDTNVEYMPIQSANGVVSWDLASLDDIPFMYDQQPKGHHDLLAANDHDNDHAHAHAHFPSSTSLSVPSPVTAQHMPMLEFYETMGGSGSAGSLVEQHQHQHQKQQVPGMMQSSHHDDDCFTPPGLTPQNAYTPPDASFYNSFEASVMDKLESGLWDDLPAGEFMFDQHHNNAQQDQSRNSSVSSSADSVGHYDNELFEMTFEGMEGQLLPGQEALPGTTSTFSEASPLTYLSSPGDEDYLASRHFSVSSATSDTFGGSDDTVLGLPTTITDKQQPPRVALAAARKNHPFHCPHCKSSFRLRGYLTRHMKKHATNKAYSCPFYNPADKNPCHPTGGFSRRDTYKTHLKARHFLYPQGTRSEHRSKVTGLCSGCGASFESNERWVEEHIHNKQCDGLALLLQ